jgi:hypothetical protein
MKNNICSRLTVSRRRLERIRGKVEALAEKQKREMVDLNHSRQLAEHEYADLLFELAVEANVAWHIRARSMQLGKRVAS